MEEPYDPRDFNLIRPYGSPVAAPPLFPRLFLSAISSEPSLHLTVGESGMIGWQDERAGYKSPPAIIMTQGSTTVGKVRPGDVRNPNRRRLRSHPDLRLISTLD